MRIVAGRFRSRRLVAPPGSTTRPSSDRLREALFAALGDLAGAACLDLFAGTGALGLEALSRGAASCTFCEPDRAARQALRANVEALGVSGEVRVVASDFRALLRGDAGAGTRYDLILVDPPYRKLRAFHEALDRSLGALAHPGARLVVESEAGTELTFNGFAATSIRRVGAATLSIMTHQEDRS